MKYKYLVAVASQLSLPVPALARRARLLSRPRRLVNRSGYNHGTESRVFPSRMKDCMQAHSLDRVLQTEARRDVRSCAQRTLAPPHAAGSCSSAVWQRGRGRQQGL